MTPSSTKTRANWLPQINDGHRLSVFFFPCDGSFWWSALFFLSNISYHFWTPVHAWELLFFAWSHFSLHLTIFFGCHNKLLEVKGALFLPAKLERNKHIMLILVSVCINVSYFQVIIQVGGVGISISMSNLCTGQKIKRKKKDKMM